MIKEKLFAISIVLIVLISGCTDSNGFTGHVTTGNSSETIDSMGDIAISILNSINAKSAAEKIAQLEPLDMDTGKF